MSSFSMSGAQIGAAKAVAAVPGSAVPAGKSSVVAKASKGSGRSAKGSIGMDSTNPNSFKGVRAQGAPRGTSDKSWSMLNLTGGAPSSGAGDYPARSPGASRMV